MKGLANQGKEQRFEGLSDRCRHSLVREGDEGGAKQG